MNPFCSVQLAVAKAIVTKVSHSHKCVLPTVLFPGHCMPSREQFYYIAVQETCCGSLLWQLPLQHWYITFCAAKRTEDSHSCL